MLLAEWEADNRMGKTIQIVWGKEAVDKVPATASRYEQKTYTFPTGTIRVLEFKKDNGGMVHAITTRAVDVVLAGLLLIGGVVGAQYGALLTLRIKPDYLRLALAVIILLVALRMALGLAWRPDEIFSIEYL